MGKIVITTNATLDGVVQDPDGQEGFKLGGWFHQHVGKDFEAWVKRETDEALQARALLLGRRSDAWFGPRMNSGEGGERVGGPWADRVNAMPKYVVSSTLKAPVWKNSTLLKGDMVTEVSKLRQKIDGDIVVYGSYQLGHALMKHDLVDELRIVVFPVVLGTGERLFGETGGAKPFRLAETRPLGESLAFHSYQRA